MTGLTWVTAALCAATLSLAACQTSRPVDRSQLVGIALADRAYADEAADWGISPRGTLLVGGYHARTPTAVPGARTIATADLLRLLTADPSVVLVDVLGGSAHPGLPQSVWLVDAGLGKGFDDPLQAKLGERLAQLTGGDRQRPVVFYCLSAECWLSYNASLRAVALGYRSVLWYRGGIEAWRAAGLPMAPAIGGW
ncbi:rhodanese-like domain-containing protein [Azospirillum sp. A26]|uniref:rhodanese-like domain-containing protein n=1 Tax=Azospirillum sp. A26 TaxID=3160607 RepID=UPI00366BAAED